MLPFGVTFLYKGGNTFFSISVQHDPRVNPYGGAIALGHPLGMSGARITGTSALQLDKTGDKALATMCIGVGQGIAITMEKI